MFTGEGGGLRSYHVIFTDAIVIGGQEVSSKPYSERLVSFTLHILSVLRFTRHN